MRLVLFMVLGLALGSGWVRGSDLSLKEATAARKLYVTKCAKCHKFYDPAKYSDEQWHVWMAKMSKKAKLTPQQEELLPRYIEEALRRPQKIQAAASKSGKP